MRIKRGNIKDLILLRTSDTVTAVNNCALKDQVHPKLKICYLVTRMLMESHRKFYHLQNISGASQQNNVAAFCQTTEVDRD